jgi:hypothetical protein
MPMISTLINGVLGETDESLLEKRTGELDNDNEYTTWVEYWYEGVLVHRSAHVTLKRNVSAESAVGGFGG